MAMCLAVGRDTSLGRHSTKFDITEGYQEQVADTIYLLLLFLLLYVDDDYVPLVAQEDTTGNTVHRGAGCLSASSDTLNRGSVDDVKVQKAESLELERSDFQEPEWVSCGESMRILACACWLIIRSSQPGFPQTPRSTILLYMSQVST